MAILPRQVEGTFDEAFFDFLASHEGLVPRVYSDSRGIPTLGIGYAMLANTPGWPPMETLERDLAAIGIALTARDRLLLIDIGEALSRHDLNRARKLATPRCAAAGAVDSAFSFTLSCDQARALFELSRPDVEVVVQRKLGRDLLARLDGSRELVALLSLAYDNPALIGPRLVKALAGGARERAWYEIRFGVNQGAHARQQHRRNRESTLFGLTNDASSEAERSAVAALLDDRRLVIKRYLMDLGLGESDARAGIAQLYTTAGLNLPPCLHPPGDLSWEPAAPACAPQIPQDRRAFADR